MTPAGVPDPALVVLVGPSGSGKSTWAAQHFRAAEIVSSDALRGIAGSGPHDLDASEDAFSLLDQIVAARLRRRLPTVVDTLGTDTARRRRWSEAARAEGVPVVAVVFDTPAGTCRRRNAARDRPVPAAVLSAQLRAHRAHRDALPADFDHVMRVGVDAAEPPVPPAEPAPLPARSGERRNSQGLRVFLQLSRFPWGVDPAGWLREVALAADAAGLTGLALMDHLIQIPQVDRAWAPIPEPWVSLGLLAALDTDLQLGTLCTPVTFRPAGVTAKAAATLDALSAGRAFLGIGAGWWEREHAGYGLPFPPARERVDGLEHAVDVVRALWAPGTKAHQPSNPGGVSLPETTCYPRPAHEIEVIVGGTGPRVLRVAAEAGAANVPSGHGRLDEMMATLRRYRDDVTVTVLDLPTIGLDRDDTWARVERLRGRAAAAAYASRTHAGTPADQRTRWGALADRGVDAVFVALADLESAEDLERLAPLAR